MLLLKIAAGLAAVPVAAGTLVLATGVAVVDVREGGPGGNHIVVPVPLALVRTAAAFAPRHALSHMQDGEARDLQRYLPVAQEMVDQLAAAPDGELVRVEDGDETVRIAKQGDVLQIRVHGANDEDVSVNAPLSMVSRLLRATRSGEVDVSAAASALQEARFTDLVEVQDGADHVKISIW